MTPPPNGGVPPFDPLKVIGEVQRQAMDSAGRVISQFLDLANSTTASPPGGAPPGPGPGNFQQLRADMGRAVDLYVDLFQRTFETYADLTESTLRQQERGKRQGPTLRSEDETSSLALTAPAGGTAEAKVWLHNLTDQPTVPAAVTATVLTAHGGARIEADRITVDPPGLPAVPPDGSTAAVIRVVLADDQQPGLYYGHLLTPAAALPLHLTVEPTG
jgi:hypothetical protein